MTPEDLEGLVLEADDLWEVQRALKSLDEKERGKLSSAAQKLHRQLYFRKATAGASLRLQEILAQTTGEIWNTWNQKDVRAAALALYALCPISVVKKPEVRIWGDMPILDRIVRDRRPDWLDDWIAYDLENRPPRLDFATLRGWVRDGICIKPQVDGYYSMYAWYLMRTGFYRREENVPPITVQLLNDPGLLEDVEGLFRVENIAFNTNGWLRKGASEAHETWTEALIKLSSQGHLNREHLLTLALEGLTRDLKQNQLSGFHSFYKQMAPSADELVRHQQSYIALLCHPVGHVVKFAIDMLAEIEKQGALDTEPVLREIPTVFSSDGKGNATAVLKLISRIIARQKGAPCPSSLAAVSEALRHAHAEVQSLALNILEANASHLGEPQLQLLKDMAPYVSASNRTRLLSLLAKGATPQPTARDSRDTTPAPTEGREPFSYWAISDDINECSVLAAEDELRPITSVDALIEATSHALEIVDSPDDIERIIDAISRLANDRPSDFEKKVSPLLHRLKTGGGTKGLVIGLGGVGGPLLDLVYTWVTGKLYRTPIPKSEYYAPEAAFAPMGAHLRAVTQRVANREARGLLCAPTHKGGWIDPLVWVERLKALPEPHRFDESIDFRLSLLRLAPDNREAALAEVIDLPSPLRRIVTFALGGNAAPAKADRTAHASWITAARARAPHRDWSSEFAPLGLDDTWPDSLRPARYVWRSSHKAGQHERLRWKHPEFKLEVCCGGGAPTPRQTGGIVSRLIESVNGRVATQWHELPTAALNRHVEAKRFWFTGDLNATWVAQWLSYVWPQNSGPAHIKGAARLALRMDENSSSWGPHFGHFQALFQRNRPWLEPGHLLLGLGLVAKDADSKGLAVDALVEGIDGGLFDPEVFADVMTRLAQGEWMKLNRLADGLKLVMQVSPLHAFVVSEFLQKWLPTLDLQHNNAFRLLEVLVEAQAVTKQSLSDQAQDVLRKIGGAGKATKIARQLLDA